MARATPTASPQRASRSRCSSCSSISGSVDRSPTAVSTTGPIPNTGPTAVSNSLITAPTKPSKMSSDFSLQLDAQLLTRVSTISQSFCLTSVSQESRACLQLAEFYARTDPNQTENM